MGVLAAIGLRSINYREVESGVYFRGFYTQRRELNRRHDAIPSL